MTACASLAWSLLMVLDITLKSYFDVHSSAWHHSQEALNKPKLLQNEASVKKKEAYWHCKLGDRPRELEEPNVSSNSSGCTANFLLLTTCIATWSSTAAAASPHGTCTTASGISTLSEFNSLGTVRAGTGVFAAEDCKLMGMRHVLGYGVSGESDCTAAGAGKGPNPIMPSSWTWHPEAADPGGPAANPRIAPAAAELPAVRTRIPFAHLVELELHTLANSRAAVGDKSDSTSSAAGVRQPSGVSQ